MVLAHSVYRPEHKHKDRRLCVRFHVIDYGKGLGPITHLGPAPSTPATFATDFNTSAHVSHQDYTGSHFDRGHMCPAYAMWSRRAGLRC